MLMNIPNIRMIVSLSIIAMAIPIVATEPIQAQTTALAEDTATVAEVARPSFNGHWLLNTSASDDPAQVMRQARPEGGGRSGGGQAGGGGRSGGGQGDSGPSIEMQQRLVRKQKEYSRLTIFHDGPELNITDGLEISRLMYTDGRETSIWTSQGEATVTAGWRENTLTVRIMVRQGGPERVRHYTLSGDGTQLTMIEEMARPKQQEPHRIKRVYDRTP